MSEMELHVGKIKKLNVSIEQPFEDQIKELESLGYVLEDVYIEDGYAFCENLEKLEDGWYDTQDLVNIGNDELLMITNDAEKNVFNVIVNFYNGGASLTEALDYALKVFKTYQ